jgi:hypothetical protein
VAFFGKGLFELNAFFFGCLDHRSSTVAA